MKGLFFLYIKLKITALSSYMVCKTSDCSFEKLKHVRRMGNAKNTVQLYSKMLIMGIFVCVSFKDINQSYILKNLIIFYHIKATFLH